jgi:hypothetical protein
VASFGVAFGAHLGLEPHLDLPPWMASASLAWMYSSFLPRPLADISENSWKLFRPWDLA